MRTKGYRPYEGKRRTILWKTLLTLVVLGVVLFGSLAALVQWGAHDRIEGEPKAMVILGCQVKPWGPSILLQDRLDTALDYLEEHPDLTVVVSGGQGADEPSTEARAMFDYLVEHGVKAEQIIQEDESHNTMQNLQYSKERLLELGLDLARDEVLLVSSGFHLTRVRMLAERQAYGVVSTLAAPVSDVPSAIKMFFREPLALVKSFLLDR